MIAPKAKNYAFKAKEIEELADVFFFRPLGLVCAYGARAVGLSPTAVTIVGMVIGILGGGLLYWDFTDGARWGYLAFALIIVHSILDSSDGQLARMTGHVTEFGKIMDGVGGFMTHIAIYVAILAGMSARGSNASISSASLGFVVLAAAITNLIHAQMYDYHRSSYVRAVIDGRAMSHTGVRRDRFSILSVYEIMQAALAGRHPEVEAAIVARSTDGRVRDEDRARYRALFYWPVRGWNLMGDNTRFYAVGVLVWLDRLDWFFAFVLVPMNLALVALWLWQWQADRRFLSPYRAVIG